MEFRYQRGLPHQQKAIDAITGAFEGVWFAPPQSLFSNPLLDGDSPALQRNIEGIQADARYNVPASARAFTPAENGCLSLDIKMETGTGKTYVYAWAIYELHKRFGINKFVVAVPSIAIKEGARSFLGDPAAKSHFAEECGYDAGIDLCVAEAAKNKESFPSAVKRFVSGSRYEEKRICVLLVNSQLLTDSKNTVLGRNYSQKAEDFYNPLDAIAATRPFVIIDEPHRFKRYKITYGIITDRLRPQCIMRFGATFPQKSEGRGKQKKTTTDYRNLIYNLDARAAFNQNLVKGVVKYHCDAPGGEEKKMINILDIDANTESVRLQYIREETTEKGSGIGQKTFTLRKGDSLGIIDGDVSDLSIAGIKKGILTLSNGQEWKKGEKISVGIYPESYQEAMLGITLDHHFEAERKNFARRRRIKTLALLFIDDIESIRGEKDGGGTGWLRKLFESMLDAKLREEIDKCATGEEEYKSFLEASLADVSECCAGYFAQDKNSPKENERKEAEQILRSKSELLPFKDAKGNWVTCRFLFSKWTLREGWDNPNVFTIAKLRTNGSDTGKLQEVGRGLRLPVDEDGSRISNEDFWLSYIVDFRERDFAQKLVNEINGLTENESKKTNIADELPQWAEILGMSETELMNELLQKKYIDTDKNLLAEKEDFWKEYPQLAPLRVTPSKVIDGNGKKEGYTNIRKENYEKIAELWKKLNRRYIIYLNGDIGCKIRAEFKISNDVFRTQTFTVHKDELKFENGRADVARKSETEYKTFTPVRPMHYNEFLKRINLATSLPIREVHRIVSEYFKTRTFKPEYINAKAATQFITEFKDWEAENITASVKYRKANYDNPETALTDASGKMLPSIPTYRLGETTEDGLPQELYLYDKIAWDSTLEQTDIKTKIAGNDDMEIVVFGKIPRRSIAIPTLNGTYSPDFMFVVRRNGEVDEMNVVLEVKDVEGNDDLRGKENRKISCAEKFFEQMRHDGVNVRFGTQLHASGLSDILEKLTGK